jgi:hypothetical protein
MSRALLVLILTALLAAVPAGGSDGSTRIKNTNGWIETIDMDGPLLAYDVDGPNCNKLFVWNVATEAGARVSGSQTCHADSTSTGGGVTDIAVAGQRLAWIISQGGNTESSEYLYTASLPKPKERRIAGSFRTGEPDGSQVGTVIGGLVGDVDVLAVNLWKKDESGDVATASLRRIDPGRLTTIATGLGSLRASAADAGRIAVTHEDGTIGLFTSSGKLQRTFTPSSASEAALRGNSLVVLTETKRLEIYNATTGGPVKTLPVVAGAARLDVHAGIAVYAAGRRVHVLRLSDGRDRVLATAPRDIEGLEIEQPGVVYAWNVYRAGRGSAPGKEIGNLAYMPLARVTSLLG